MLRRAITALQRRLSPRLELSKRRGETLALLVIGMIGARTVNPGHVASERPGETQIASTYRRHQRFFQHVDLGLDWSAPLVANLLGLVGSWHLALDRTQWQIGGRDVNFLVLAAVTRWFRVPLIWTVIEGRGCSDTEQRIALMQRYLRLFGRSTIKLLLADRAFVGVKWIEFLCKNDIPFAIRLREDMRVPTEAGHELGLAAHPGRRGRSRFIRGRFANAGAEAPPLTFALKRLRSGDLLAVVSNRPAPAALNAYRKRWAIECLFGDARTRGLNLEDTRPTNPRKLALLMALVALVIVWAGRAAADKLGNATPKRGAHGFLAQSWFRTGFDLIRNRLAAGDVDAVLPWRKLGKPLAQPARTGRVV